MQAVTFLLNTTLPLSAYQPTSFALLTPDYSMSPLSIYSQLTPEALPIASIASFTSSAKEFTTFYCYDLLTFPNRIRDEY